MSEKKDKNKEKNWLWVVIVVLIAIIILLLLRSCDMSILGGHFRNPTYGTSGEIVQGEIEYMTSEEIQQKVNETVAKGMFQVFMNTKITVNENNEMDLKIQNNKNNHYDCYVVIMQGNSQIYKSGVISPGYKLESDILQIDLDDGTYDCVAYFCVLNNEGSETNRVGLEIKLTKGEI